MAGKSMAKGSIKTVKVVGFAKGQRVDLGNGSYSNLILTKSTIKDNKSMMGYSVFRPGTNIKQKIHVDAEELAYVITGSGKITIKDKAYPFRPGDSVYIPPGVPHGIRNDGTKDVVMVFFFSSSEYPKSIDA
jgi:quercetin dioxygenase-like cupin family protein